MKSPDLTDEAASIVEVFVDEKAVGETRLEPSEDIQSFWVTSAQYRKLVASLDPEKYTVDVQVLCYFLGRARTRTPKRA